MHLKIIRSFSRMKISLVIICLMVLVSCQSTFGPHYFESFYAERQQHLIDLVAHEQAPLQAVDLSAVSHFQYDANYRVHAKYVATEDAKPFDMATYSGKTKAFIEKGVLYFIVKGQKSKIHVYQNLKYANHPVYGAYFFIPFKDLTSGDETYGGGRYLDLPKEMFTQKKIMLDFNKAYNPWCAYSDGYNCPIPPSENELNIFIRAGEKMFEKSKH